MLLVLPFFPPKANLLWRRGRPVGIEKKWLKSLPSPVDGALVHIMSRNRRLRPQREPHAVWSMAKLVDEVCASRTSDARYVFGGSTGSKMGRRAMTMTIWFINFHIDSTGGKLQITPIAVTTSTDNLSLWLCGVARRIGLAACQPSQEAVIQVQTCSPTWSGGLRVALTFHSRSRDCENSYLSQSERFADFLSSSYMILNTMCGACFCRREESLA